MVWNTSKKVAMVGRGALSLLTVAYSLVTTSALRVVYCVRDGGDLVLAHNTFVACYSGEHSVAAGLAWVVLAVFSVGFPVSSFLYLWSRHHPTEHFSGQSPAFQVLWGNFVAQDYQPQYFWVLHLGMADGGHHLSEAW